ncbi:ATP-binding protein [Echinicola strongylocentroti]|uniref:ATP-binding protein n=1 Tax=Echinicola strongylocentroti TaxID=1795355 RepID=A0A2Z4IE86_9BACT|nr:IS21-like element helper ATPase IstB [Echinicola strongylocentroti]AWW29150.1 ATP-binding protein [Echinicola strongylocentroti]AWW29187.1 ATP-binding protein [Echinicola strongylocentroti]AWW29566.1 ATP-binding protein [Echinicola strongylocentroti]AWW30672.1 ATP-binding protein [Echinicola strongylocentroti]
MPNPIETQLIKLRLHGMRQTWATLQETRKNQSLSLTEGLELMLQAEEQERDNRRFKRLESNAGFRYRASLEELSLDRTRGLDDMLLTTLATGEYMEHGDAVLITGATGCGKSYLASALGHQACVHGKKVAYFNTQKLMLKIKMVRLDGTVLKFFDKMARTDLLILDDFGLTHLDKQQQMDFMELIEDRHGKKSTVIVSQLPVSSWYDVIGEPTIADAILDRLVHASYRIVLKGESLRKKM